MRFLYVAPRYHTNQIPIMKELRESGHEICFISHYQGKIEDYTYVTPIVAGYSWLFRLIDKLYVDILHKGDAKAGNMKLKCGFPSMIKIRKLIKEFEPDVMIIRERSVYSIFTCLACKNLNIPMILYNQSPLWEKEIKNDLPHRIVKALLPKVRITPVMGTAADGREKEKGVFFVPFVMDLQLSPDNRAYCKDGVIHIFTVGKYEKRKNLLMMLETVKELSAKYEINLTIAGECSTEFHKEYYHKVEKYIDEAGLGERVTLLQNLCREEMNEEYAKADLFVLPSTEEPASISQLEAMAFSVPVVCSDTNGSACYVKNGHNGFLFKDNDKESLKEAVEKIVKDRELLVQMGKNSYLDVKNNYQFENYFEGIMECIHYLEK